MNQPELPSIVRPAFQNRIDDPGASPEDTFASCVRRAGTKRGQSITAGRFQTQLCPRPEVSVLRGSLTTGLNEGKVSLESIKGKIERGRQVFVIGRWGLVVALLLVWAGMPGAMLQAQTGRPTASSDKVELIVTQGSVEIFRSGHVAGTRTG